MSTVLSVTKREAGHRSTLTQLRKGGAIPAVIYGYNLDSTPISISAKEFKKSIQKNGQNSVFSMELEGNKVNVVVSEIQQCSLRDEVNHVDFLAINMSEALEADVPIKLVGESIGVSEGGILMQPNLEMKIKVKPAELPEAIEIDITNLKIGETITVAEIRESIGFDVVSEDDHILVTLMAPATIETTEEEQE
ncbi:50S ribosomal protein L25/general stress protein Ctc [Lysinibacillus pakistanensis]|uniref:Large ribosomal subunit protein bL25 n=1 Tax=Lysinibacillus pakistanensis TaxID=759811 RepID=A0AAX3WV67_9BACI|nr:50S ribosomal protein L25/general stress protein Ctc [Lysinibacillus pakistanensis]MDM5231187.1 50S ribosomal protein L25/general stress protein Ctc [Lysinibacillus pakistanensis]QGG49508.1 50S ribosomal protein L25/general stress protein Ctc [Lysinibacillus pakistanensis]WHY46742.1 50S ribosomal protein L25/general stress protein Ctc [Lysinibacillus pakistanensis]WHY51755.1 50S ribosomal protein L25/general stress protein Ctc [Lysinibacillus pakistanensis]